MSTKTTVDLSSIGYFYYTSDLKIEPQIPKVKHKGAHFELRTKKDEDVQIINGEITVVTSEVTSLLARQEETDQQYDATQLKSEIDSIATLAKSNKATLNGQVVIHNGADQVVRILVTDNKVEVQEGKLAAIWPDRTSSPLPKGEQ